MSNMFISIYAIFETRSRQIYNQVTVKSRKNIVYTLEALGHGCNPIFMYSIMPNLKVGHVRVKARSLGKF